MLWNVFRRARLDDDLQQEIETHLALIEEAERAQGADAEQARQRARAAFGSPLGYRERAVDAVVATWIARRGREARSRCGGWWRVRRSLSPPC